MKALLVMDMIYVYVNGKWYDKDRKPLIRNIRAAIDHAHKSGMPVIYVNSLFRKGDPILRVIGHRKQAIKGEKGTGVVKELAPTKQDHVLEKRGYDGFWRSRLEATLRSLDVKEIYLTGQQTDCCIRETGVTAAHLGYKVNVIQDCCVTSRRMGQQSSLWFISRAVGKVITLRQYIIATSNKAGRSGTTKSKGR